MCKFYVLCPANIETGGVELLHQLVYKLNEIKKDCAVICYENVEIDKSPIPQNYVKYTRGRFVTEIKESKDSILIIPEIWIHLIDKYKKIKIVVWWMSVDNFYEWVSIINSKKPLNYKFFKAGKKYTLYKVLNFFNIKPAKEYMPFSKKFLYNRRIILHTFQSEYSRLFLNKHALRPILPLSDYLNSSFFSNEINLLEKKDMILYNPKKGLPIVNELMVRMPEYLWLPLENYSPSQMVKVMQESKIYVDFGNHPGKDRIPREAAVNGCIVITNRLGSAANAIDIPVIDKYKFNNPIEEFSIFKTLIDDIYIHYHDHFANFFDYRKKIRNEQSIFNKELVEYYQFCQHSTN